MDIKALYENIFGLKLTFKIYGTWFTYCYVSICIIFRWTDWCYISAGKYIIDLTLANNPSLFVCYQLKDIFHGHISMCLCLSREYLCR